MLMPNLRGKPVFIIILTALLYLPAIYVLLDRFYFSDEVVSDGKVIRPESGHREKIPDTGDKQEEEEKNVIVRTDGIQNSTLGFEKIFFISLPE